MSIFDNAKKALDAFKTRASGRIQMKVCMMGPRAVGKTTILTAVFNNTLDDLGVSTNLLLQAEGDTRADLTQKKRYLQSVFANRTDITDKPSAGLAGTATVNTFDFVFGLKGKEPRIDMEIKDFPGEYVVDHPDDVIRFINESSAVFVAIDTPHLMEEGGKYCEVKNKPSAIIDFFKQQSIDAEKLVLFVPLKCERYFHEKRMDEVLRRVEEVYEDLISGFKANGKVACAVTPILTLGDVEFERFKTTPQGNIATLSNGYPEEAIYRFRGNNPQYTPTFCMQPLYYMLSFLASQYERNKKQRGFIDKVFSSVFNLFDSDTALFDEILRMEKNRKTDLPGYKVLCGADLFKYCK